MLDEHAFSIVNIKDSRYNVVMHNLSSSELLFPPNNISYALLQEARGQILMSCGAAPMCASGEPATSGGPKPVRPRQVRAAACARKAQLRKVAD